jgi:hypothetical protein
MAFAESRSIAGALKGSVGKELVFREWDGKIVVSKYSASNVEATPAQAKTRENFSLASRFAKSVLKNPDNGLAEAYAAALKPRQNVYSRALEDFMSPPVVKLIDTRNYNGTPGSVIVVHAVDDFRVTGVSVEIFLTGNILLESGDAIIDTNNLNWIYTCKKANSLARGFTIKATATDIPGNTGTLELTL